MVGCWKKGKQAAVPYSRVYPNEEDKVRRKETEDGVTGGEVTMHGYTHTLHEQVGEP